MKYLSNINLNLNEIQNVVIQNLNTDPITFSNGQIYYDTSISKLKLKIPSGWVIINSGPTGIGPGTINRVSKFITTSSIGDSIIEDNGSSVIITGDLYANSFYTNTGYALMSDGTVIGQSFQFPSTLSYLHYVGVGFNVWDFPDQTGTIALVSDITAATTLNAVLTNDNVSQIDAKVGGIYLYNPHIGSGNGYVYITGDKNRFNFYNNANVPYAKINQNSLSFVDFINNTLEFVIATPATITNNRIATFQDATGTIAYLSDIPSLVGYVPYTGATQAVNLGAYNLTVNNISFGIGNGISNSNIVVGGSNAGISLSTGQYNSFFGNFSGRFTTTGTFNSFMGYASGYFNELGSFNTSLGTYASFNNTTGNYNSAIGVSSNRANTSGTGNTTLGAFSSHSNTIGNYNTNIGYGTGYFVTTGNNNVYLGLYAGRLISGGGNNTTSSNSVFLGANTAALGDNQINQIVIGANAVGLGSNTVVLGNDSIVTTVLKGNVLLGTTTNNTVDKLQVVGSILADTFKKSNGLPTEFLKADGSVSLIDTYQFMVYGGGTDIENATELQNAYNYAKTQSPSATNILTVVVSPGNYNFQTTDFVLDTEYINVVSLDGNQSVLFNGVNTININIGNVLVVGINTLTKRFVTGNFATMVIENCTGGNESFGTYATAASGTFNNCTGGAYSFGYGATTNGTFNNCTGGVQSFGAYATANGKFTNCTSGNYSFGAFGIASGTFTNCTGGGDSFGYYGTASGTFNNCTGGSGSFGYGGTASGTFTNCTGGDYSFGYYGTASGTFTNCTSGVASFGKEGTLSGKLYYCRLTSGTFITVSAGGRTVLCIDGNNTINNQ